MRFCKICDGFLKSYDVVICERCMTAYYPRVRRSWGKKEVRSHGQVEQGK